MSQLCLTSNIQFLSLLASLLFILTGILFYVLAESHPRKHRIFHYLLELICLVGALSYLSPVTGIGVVSFDSIRCVYWIKWIDLSLTLPLLIFTLSLLAGSHLHVALFVSAASSLSGMCLGLGSISSALSASARESIEDADRAYSQWCNWMFFGLNLIIYLEILRGLLIDIVNDSKHQSILIERRVFILRIILIVYTLGIELIWLMSDGLYIITNTTAFIILVGMDITLRILFGLVLLSEKIFIFAISEIRNRHLDSNDAYSIDDNKVLDCSIGDNTCNINPINENHPLIRH